MAREYKLKPSLLSGAAVSAFSATKARNAELSGKSAKTDCGPGGSKSGGKVPENGLQRAGGHSRAQKTAIAGEVPGADSTGTGESVGLVNGAISERSAKIRFLKDCWSEAPIVGFRMLKNDVQIIRKARNPEELAERLEGAERGNIEFLSGRSRRRLAIVAGNCDVVFRSFVTLTYPAEFPCDGKIVKRHLHAVLAALRRKCPGVSYLWFLEFQKRGAPHLHVFLSAEMPGPLETMKRAGGRVRKSVQTYFPWQDWLSSRWFEIVGSGDAKHLRAGAAWEVVEKPDGAARYVAKECYKTWQKVVPEDFQSVGRFWGCSRDVRVDPGREVFCGVVKMQKIFESGCFDSEGEPFPVLFGAAESSRKFLESDAPNAKRRAWHKGSPQKDLTCTKKSVPTGTAIPSPFSGLSPGCVPSKRIRRGINAQDEWHGSIVGK